jgi:hypothetical protein
LPANFTDRGFENVALADADLAPTENLLDGFFE